MKPALKSAKSPKNLEDSQSQNLNERIIKCVRCPRLIEYCQNVGEVKKKSFAHWTYWAKPVPNFGSFPSKILIIGLAPAANGGNRTGRMFTGDRSGEWLYRALHRAGLANQAHATSIDDGLTLIDTVITAVGHCAPPDNKLTPAEILNCQIFFKESILLSNATVFIALGKIAWDAIIKEFKPKYPELKSAKFKHGEKVAFGENKYLLASYHPSQQNTFTGRLTEKMFDEVFDLAKIIISS
jgi:uracil-DNA glycosylase family 4